MKDLIHSSNSSGPTEEVRNGIRSKLYKTNFKLGFDNSAKLSEYQEFTSPRKDGENVPEPVKSGAEPVKAKRVSYYVIHGMR